jgi:hypothetical protein
MDILHTLPAGPQHASRTGHERRVNSHRQARHLGTPEAPLIFPRAQALSRDGVAFRFARNAGPVRLRRSAPGTPDTGRAVTRSPGPDVNP